MNTQGPLEGAPRRLLDDPRTKLRSSAAYNLAFQFSDCCCYGFPLNRPHKCTARLTIKESSGTKGVPKAFRRKKKKNTTQVRRGGLVRKYGQAQFSRGRTWGEGEGGDAKGTHETSFQAVEPYPHLAEGLGNTPARIALYRCESFSFRIISIAPRRCALWE